MRPVTPTSPDSFRAMLAAGRIRPASLQDVEGRRLYRYPNSGAFYVERKPA